MKIFKNGKKMNGYMEKAKEKNVSKQKSGNKIREKESIRQG